MITTRDGIVNALANNSSRIVWDKASIANQTAGGFASLWRATGRPAQGAIPTSSALCTKALTGAIGFTNQTDPVTSYIGWHCLTTGNAATNLEIHDRLAHMGGLVGNVTTSQTVTGMNLASLSVPSARLGDSNYGDVQWYLEWYTDTGATASNATVNVTFDDDSTGNLAVIAVGGTVRAGRCLPLISNVNGKFIKAVNSVILSASTGTAGNFGVTATRQRTAMSTNIANKTETFFWEELGLPNVPNDSCLFGMMVCSTTTTGTIRGQGKIAHG